MKRYSPMLRENFGEARSEASMREAADGGYIDVGEVPIIQAQAKALLEAEIERLRAQTENQVPLNDAREAVELLARIGYTTHTGWRWDHIANDELQKRHWRRWAKARVQELLPAIRAQVLEELRGMGLDGNARLRDRQIEDMFATLDQKEGQ